MHRVVLGLNNKGRRSSVGDLDVGVESKVPVVEGEVAGIDKHREVGPATELVSGAHRSIKTPIEMGAQGRSQVGSGREAKHADAMRINVPLGSMSPDEPHCTLSVLQRGRRFGKWPRVGYT